MYNTYHSNFSLLFAASQTMIVKMMSSLDENKNLKDDMGRLVYPCILTFYSAFENFLSEVERLINNEEILDLTFDSDNKPDILSMPFALFESISGNKFDKANIIYEDYLYFIKLRNQISHSKSEWIKWKNFDWQVGDSVNINKYFIPKDEFKRFGRDALIVRDKQADKIISFLYKKKIIYVEPKNRILGWLHCIEFPKVAVWSYKTVYDMMRILNEEVGKVGTKNCDEFYIRTKKSVYLLQDNP